MEFSSESNNDNETLQDNEDIQDGVEVWSEIKETMYREDSTAFNIASAAMIAK